VIRSWVVAALLAPTVLALLWRDAVALYVGIARAGVQAEYYPPPTAEPGSHDVRVLETRRIVPSRELPASVKVFTPR
jgi:hypothetical protein